MLWRRSEPLNVASGSVYDLGVSGASTWAWCGGSMLGLFLGLQLITGVFLSMHYSSSPDGAFFSVQHVIRDVPGGWFLQSMHANGASFFFVVMYAHLCRGLYYGSYRMKLVWLTGMVLLVLSMGVAFTGYVLVWGQMSYWGLTVITNLVGAMPYAGPSLVDWILGGPSPSGATLSRFFSFHFITPMIVAATAILHVVSLHMSGSSSGVENKAGKHGVRFFPLFVVKDYWGFVSVLFVFLGVVFESPDIFADAANSEMANMYFAPTHIQPEWYFLWAYAILRCFPTKGGGILLMLGALAAVYFVCFSSGSPATLNLSGQVLFWGFVSNLAVLSYLGGCPATAPYVGYSACCTVLYFSLLGGFINSSHYSKLHAM